jgi:subtilisin family serine protease
VRKLIVLLAGIFFGVQSFGAFVDPSLQAFARGEAGSIQQVLVLVKSVGQIQRPQRYDRANVIKYYKESARQSVQPILVSLQNNELSGLKYIHVFWINGSFLANVTPEGLKQLANHPSVTKIYRNGRLGNEPGLHKKPAKMRSGLLDANVQQDYAFPSIGLDQLAKEHPEVTGKGVIVGAVDTGVDGTHPALQGKIPLFYNGETKTTTEPKDFDEHGTHVSGTIAGGDRATNNIGVAPGAKLVMAGVVNQGLDSMLEGMQWFLDADKNPVVAVKIKAVGCSWNTGGAPDQEVFYRAIAAWEAAGILPVFSAGNSGDQGITPPHEYPGAFAVAAYGADGKRADFSSIGPGRYQGKDTQKPDIAAPGVDITSSIPGGAYEKMSGTSMAQPHVTGTTALIQQVNPNLNPAQIREILLRTAVPVEGQTAGQWNPEYGFGKLNAYAAVKAASNKLFATASMYFNKLVIDPNSPDAILDKDFDEDSLGEVDGPQDQFKDTDVTRWLTSKDI